MLKKLHFHLATLTKVLGNKSYAINRMDLDNNFLWALEAVESLLVDLDLFQSGERVNELSNQINVKFAKLKPEAVIPSYAKPGDAGLDLTAIGMTEKNEGGVKFYEYEFGLAIEIPKGHVGFIFPRSSITKTDLTLSNAVGVIDSGYRGTLTARFRKLVDKPQMYKAGQRVAQLVVMPYPKVNIEQVEYSELSKTERGTGGFGHTGS